MICIIIFQIHPDSKLPSFAVDVVHSEAKCTEAFFPRGAMAKTTAYMKCKSLQSKHTSAKETEKVHMKGSLK